MHLLRRRLRCTALAFSAEDLPAQPVNLLLQQLQIALKRCDLPRVFEGALVVVKQAIEHVLNRPARHFVEAWED